MKPRKPSSRPDPDDTSWDELVDHLNTSPKGPGRRRTRQLKQKEKEHLDEIKASRIRPRRRGKSTTAETDEERRQRRYRTVEID